MPKMPILATVKTKGTQLDKPEKSTMNKKDKWAWLVILENRLIARSKGRSDAQFRNLHPFYTPLTSLALLPAPRFTLVHGPPKHAGGGHAEFA